MREILIIKTVTKYEIKTKPSVGQSDDYEVSTCMSSYLYNNS